MESTSAIVSRVGLGFCHLSLCCARAIVILKVLKFSWLNSESFECYFFRAVLVGFALIVCDRSALCVQD